MTIHPTARLLGDVRLGLGTSVGPDAVLEGPLEIGPDSAIGARALVGGPAQHRAGSTGRLVLGARVQIRECATVHRGSPAGTGITRLGDRVMVMAYAHVGHDVVLGDDVTLANGAQLGGHCEIGEGATLGARCALHQFVKVGRGAMIAAGAFVRGDVPPWSLAGGARARLLGPNVHALRLRFGAESVGAVRTALRGWYGDRTLPEGGAPFLVDLRAFFEAPRGRALCPRRRP